jgi:hypothetical protein
MGLIRRHGVMTFGVTAGTIFVLIAHQSLIAPDGAAAVVLVPADCQYVRSKQIINYTGNIEMRQTNSTHW